MLVAIMWRQKESFDHAFLLRRAMSTLAKRMTQKKWGTSPSGKLGKRTLKNLNWKDISRPMPCYFVMLIISVFETLLAILLLPYNLLNRPD